MFLVFKLPTVNINPLVALINQQFSVRRKKINCFVHNGNWRWENFKNAKCNGSDKGLFKRQFNQDHKGMYYTTGYLT